MNRSTTINRYLGTALCALPAMLFAIGAGASTQPIDRIVAIVDSDVILDSEVRERTQQIMANLKRADREQLPAEKIQQEIFNTLVAESIQLQMAYRAGVRISDPQLNEAMRNVAAQNRMSLEQFKQAIEKDGLSYNSTREQIRREMMIQRVQQGSVNRRVQITDQEIDNFLESGEGQALTAPEYRLVHALIPVPNNADPAFVQQAQQYAETLYQQIQDGTPFQQAVSEQSPFNISGGDLGWRKADNLPSLFADIAPTLTAGQTAAPIRSASGFHLIYLAQKRGESELIPQTRARHILLKTSAIRDEQATEQEIQSLRQRILNGEDFAQLARDYSEDIGSAQEGGDLGWTSPGQLVTVFQQMMDDTQAGEVSTAFRSQYGWHIVQVLERRQKDVTDDLRRNIARNFIHQRKYDDELQVWLQKIRDEAYVDIK